MIETVKWFTTGQVVKITLFAAILTSGFVNLTMATTATGVGSLASKIDHLWSSKSIKERL